MRYIEYDGKKISKLSLGTVQFGLDYGIANDFGKPSQEKVNEIIKYVSNNGINCFDTAQAYGNSEQVIGTALQDIDNKLVISKLKSDNFRKSPLENVSNSIKNLNDKCLFALLLHDSELLYSWTKEDTKNVEALISSSKINYFGVSIYTSEDFELAINNDKIKFIQIPFNLFDQRAYKEKWFEKAKKHNKLLFIRSVFLQGLLLMDIDKIPPNLQSSKKYMDIVESYARDLNITKNELALSFVDTIATDSLILFGCDNIKQAEENIKNYNSLKKFDISILQKIAKDLSDIDESIYNPTKW